MSPTSAAGPTTAPPFRRWPAELPFHSGDHMDANTFYALYEQTPDGVKAELIEGVVYVASPTSLGHSTPHAVAVGWLTVYWASTPGTQVFDNGTVRLDDESVPQPDTCLVVRPECGGQMTFDGKGVPRGAPELVLEVAYTSASLDLNSKRRMYDAAGVREYVVVLADPERVRWFGRGPDGRLADRPADADGIHRSTTFPGLWLDPAAVFAAYPARLFDVLQQGLATPEHAAFAADLAARAGSTRSSPSPA